MKRLLYIACLFSITLFSGCMTCMSEMCLGKDTYERLMNSKPYGAHWIKDGMTRESRMTDWLQCGGGEGLSDGFERKSNITTNNFFDGLNLHRKVIRSCMDSKGYKWIEQCDAGCLHP